MKTRDWTVLGLGAGAAAAAAGALAAGYSGKEPPYRSPHQDRLPAGGGRGVAVAPTEEALTFARVAEGGRLRLVRVDRYAEGVVAGVALDAPVGDDPRADPITLLSRLGYAAVAAAEGERVETPDTALETPFDGTANQIAVGGNYPLHKDETSLVDSFLFPKTLRPGRFDAPVAVQGGLLDYEIELGFVALPPGGSDVPTMGLVLATDYTDRAILLERSDFSDINSGVGFTDAKSRPGYMPVGNLFVVPRDVDRFYRTLELRLYVNGGLRQVAPPGEMVWDMAEIVGRSLAAASRSWDSEGGVVRLAIEGGRVAPRTIVLSGTTDGVVFRPLSGRQKALGALEAGLQPWRARTALVGPAIREAKRDRRYLQPGDEVVGVADRLGLFRNRIVA